MFSSWNGRDWEARRAGARFNGPERNTQLANNVKGS